MEWKKEISRTRTLGLVGVTLPTRLLFVQLTGYIQLSRRRGSSKTPQQENQTGWTWVHFLNLNAMPLTCYILPSY